MEYLATEWQFIILSIPITSKPLSQKKLTASEPTKPQEPVIITTDIY